MSGLRTSLNYEINPAAHPCSRWDAILGRCRLTGLLLTIGLVLGLATTSYPPFTPTLPFRPNLPVGNILIKGTFPDALATRNKKTSESK